MASKPKKPIDFEQALTELETLVNKMEAGDLSLEESLKAFEEGVKLTRECQNQLSQAEQRVQMLLQENGQLRSVDFEDEAGDEGEPEE